METGSSRIEHRGVPPLERLVVDASRVALLVVIAAFGAAALLGRTPSLDIQMLIYLVGMVAINLPHGGYEHFTNLRRRGLPFGARYVALYLAFVAGFIAFFLLAPVLALGLAFATAVAKGGHGDLRVMDAQVGSDHLEYRWQRFLAALVRGGAVMIVPLVFWTETFVGFSDYMLALFDPALSVPLASGPDVAITALGGLFALGVVAHLGSGLLIGGASRAWLLDVFETSLLVVFFAVVPVVVAIGLYFPLWYSLRQSARSAAVNRQLEHRDDGLPVGLAWAALVVGALATATVAAVLWVVVPNPLGGLPLLPGLVAFYTIFICIVALPHVVVGEWLDVGRGIWYVP
ncbi:Brp/Blh family beta-carotene 15,15'-dioxygenase [Halobiforma nitratireducens]|uniref:Probable beta-carotene 15,15'-dioxygenase n=1 Tax=Halobiforma nitratireducens JCM 10879 TaxID=1227454 RepID=M0LGE9_9EURY|nr:Brp/Blh family beta-carotene 15,15'-dioxygenase [Halobiforma nitratireducens]EMA31055.1 bacteriorhodopsin-like protein [Halobiforma nitratireducens JCM 10879]